MLHLLQAHFVNVAPERFVNDLVEKEWALLLADAHTGEVHGFSTLMRLRLEVEGRPVVAFFSGDTIVRRDHWGETALARVWARHVFHLASEIEAASVYWFLISSGFRTYRFLPVFFRTFFPTYTRPTPAWAKGLLDAFGQQKYPSEYDACQGVIRPREPAPLRDGLGEVSDRRVADPHVAFYVAANPGHAQGNELVCLAELVPDNLTPAGRRALYGPDRNR